MSLQWCLTIFNRIEWFSVSTGGLRQGTHLDHCGGWAVFGSHLAREVLSTRNQVPWTIRMQEAVKDDWHSKCWEALEASKAPQEGKQGGGPWLKRWWRCLPFPWQTGTRGVSYEVRRQERQILYEMMMISLSWIISVPKIFWQNQPRWLGSLELGWRSGRGECSLRLGCQLCTRVWNGMMRTRGHTKGLEMLVY